MESRRETKSCWVTLPRKELYRGGHSCGVPLQDRLVGQPIVGKTKCFKWPDRSADWNHIFPRGQGGVGRLCSQELGKAVKPVLSERKGGPGLVG